MIPAAASASRNRAEASSGLPIGAPYDSQGGDDGNPARDTADEATSQTRPAGLVRSSDTRQQIDGLAGPLLITALAAFLRFDRLANPHSVVFDETYYAKDAYALLKFGHEHSTIDNPQADKLFLGGYADQVW
jgi:hypothetical protein